jgi:hypothetical protein
VADDLRTRLRALLADKGDDPHASEGKRWVLRYFPDDLVLRVDALTDALMEFIAEEARRG